MPPTRARSARAFFSTPGPSPCLRVIDFISAPSTASGRASYWPDHWLSLTIRNPTGFRRARLLRRPRRDGLEWKNGPGAGFSSTGSSTGSTGSTGSSPGSSTVVVVASKSSGDAFSSVSLLQPTSSSTSMANSAALTANRVCPNIINAKPHHQCQASVSDSQQQQPRAVYTPPGADTLTYDCAPIAGSVKNTASAFASMMCAPLSWNGLASTETPSLSTSPTTTT